MIEPKLRFKAEDGSQFPDWEEKVFGDFVDTHLKKTSDKNKYPLYSLTIESGVQPKTDRYEREFLVKKEGDNYKIVPPNAFVYNPMNLRFGALKVNHEKFSVSVSGYYDVFSLKDDSVLAFWENYLVTPKMLNYYFSIATGSLVEKLRVHYSQFVRIKKLLPSFPEQQKIAEFLSTIDTVIEKQKETVLAWEERKKGVMQKLFSREVRFITDDGNEFPEWDEKRLKNILKEYKEYSAKDGSYEHVSLTKEGVVPKSERYERDFLVKDTHKKYRVTHLGDICYNPANLKFGVICRNKYGDGIFSPIYVTFKVCKDMVPEFVEMLVTRRDFIEYALKYEQGTVYERMSVSSDDLLSIKVMVPCIAEQQKIADCLSSLDEVIEKQKATLAAWEELKKGLLQKMFV